MKPSITIKRAYEDPAKQDGHRILVDRLWPRGVKKEAAAIDDWEKEIAPSTKLRTWFGHKPELWPDFQKRYQAELKENPHVKEFIEKYKGQRHITLVYAAKDEAHTHALVLQHYLERAFHG